MTGKQVAGSERFNQRAPTRGMGLATLKSVDQLFDIEASTILFPRNALVFGEGEPADFFYRIELGYIRTFRILKDGRRHIDAFYVPGEVFGLESCDRCAVSAEAINRCRIRLIRKSKLFTHAAMDSSVFELLFAEALVALQRAKDHSGLLRKNAQERIVGFLLDMKNREEQAEVNLPMTRGDIADYLGLTTETVSRTLWKLESISAISVKRRSVVLLDMRALKQIDG